MCRIFPNFTLEHEPSLCSTAPYLNEKRQTMLRILNHVLLSFMTLPTSVYSSTCLTESRARFTLTIYIHKYIHTYSRHQSREATVETVNQVK